MERRGISTHVSVTITIAAMVVIASLAAAEQLPTVPSQDGGNIAGRPWPCCNQCGVCVGSFPPKCTCFDQVHACHPSCENCVQLKMAIFPPLFQCRDLITNYCEKKCDPKYAEGGEVVSAV